MNCPNYLVQNKETLEIHTYWDPAILFIDLKTYGSDKVTIFKRINTVGKTHFTPITEEEFTELISYILNEE